MIDISMTDGHLKVVLDGFTRYDGLYSAADLTEDISGLITLEIQTPPVEMDDWGNAIQPA